MPPASSVSWILPAAGSGRRMGAATPKPFLSLAGQPVLAWTLRAVRRMNPAEIVLVLPADACEELTRDYASVIGPSVTVVPGGASRQASVARGFAACRAKSEYIAVHDAVRPFPSRALLDRIDAAARRHGAALPVLPLTDTIRRLSPAGEEEMMLDGTVARDRLVAVQTPQIFARPLFEEAYARAASLGEEVTDDASLVESAGVKVAGVPGERTNLKITSPEDLRLAAALLAAGLVDAGENER